MPATIRQYELVYILHPDRTEEQVNQIIDKYNGIITRDGGTLERTDVWERRRLAYEIKGQHEGIYIVSLFRALPPVEAELRRVFLISEDTLRFIIVRPDEELDATVPSVQPREFGARAAHSPLGQGPSPVAAVREAEADEESDDEIEGETFVDAEGEPAGV
jgi:small subunit ribosomal protein S6